MQFVGAVTIVAEIIGPEKIRRFGTSLQSMITPNNLLEFLKDCFDWYIIVFQRTLMKDYTNTVSSTVSRKKNSYSQLDILNYFVCFVLTIVILILIKLQHLSWLLLVEAIIIFGCLMVSVAPLTTVFIILMFTLTGILINSVFIKPLAWVLEHPSLDRSTKIFSFLFLLIGFHFELLAS